MEGGTLVLQKPTIRLNPAMVLMHMIPGKIGTLELGGKSPR